MTMKVSSVSLAQHTVTFGLGTLVLDRDDGVVRLTVRVGDQHAKVAFKVEAAASQGLADLEAAVAALRPFVASRESTSRPPRPKTTRRVKVEYDPESMARVVAIAEVMKTHLKSADLADITGLSSYYIGHILAREGWPVANKRPTFVWAPKGATAAAK